MVRRNLGLPHRLISKNFNCVIWVKHERRIEFAMEAERFYDLVRWGDANTVFTLHPEN